MKKAILQFELLTTYYSKSSCKMSHTPKYIEQTLSALIVNVNLKRCRVSGQTNVVSMRCRLAERFVRLNEQFHQDVLLIFSTWFAVACHDL